MGCGVGERHLEMAHPTTTTKKTRRVNNFICFGGGSHDLVVMGGDSHSEGCGFESQCRILDGHFSH